MSFCGVVVNGALGCWSGIVMGRNDGMRDFTQPIPPSLISPLERDGKSEKMGVAGRDSSAHNQTHV